MPNEHSDRFLRVDNQFHKLAIVNEPSKPANKQDKEPDITGCVFAPVAGLIPLTLVGDFNQLTSDQVTAYSFSKLRFDDVRQSHTTWMFEL